MTTNLNFGLIGSETHRNKSNMSQTTKLPTYREQIDAQLAKMKIPEETRFQPKRLPTFSPFIVTQHQTLHTITQRKGVAGTFDSASELVTISPKSKPNLEINVVMFQDDWDKIRSLITLNGKCYINAEYDTSKKPAEMNYSFAGTPV